MKQMKQWMHWVLALVLLVMSLSVPAAAAETITVNVTNTPVRGSVALEKTGLQLVRFTDEQDEWGNTVMKPVYQQGYLTGAVFELRAAADVVGKEGTVFYKQGELVETLTTSADGAVNSKLLPLGSYCLQEVSAPDGYLLDDTPYPFTLTAAGKQTAVVEVKVSAVNTYLPIRVTLHKQQEAIRVDETADGMIRSSIETVPGEGCVFGLFNAGVIAYGDSQKLPAHTLMATGITDAKGNLTFSGMYPHGAYYVKELSAPDGWLLNTEQYPVQLTPENMDAAEEAIAITLDAPILNRLIYTPVTITKRDVAGKEPLPGALIEVYDAQGSTIYRAYTDENGQLPDIPLVPGSYTFKETYAPEGYALNVAVKTFTVTSEGKIIGETEIRDEINKIQLKKVKENGEPLPGAVFGIYDANNTLVQQQTSDDSGYLTFSKLGYGTYTIREIQAPYGYHPSTGEWQVTIDGTYQNPVQILTTVVNEDAPGWIRVIKTDALDGHPIAGVRFDIYALNEDGSTGDLVSTMLTNDDGVAMSESLLVGDYMVKEHEAPVGYGNSLWSEKVTVVMAETVERSVTNIPMQGQVRIVKTDAETGGSLAGAVFTVIRVSGLPSHGKEGCGEVVAVITTDAEGVAVTPVLTWGIYEIRETTVPDGYLDSGCVVTVSIPGNADRQEKREASMNTKRNILPMLLAALLLFCLPMASLAEDVPIQNVSIRNTPIKGQILLEKTGQMQTTGEQGYLKGAVFEIRAAEDIVGQDGTQWYSCGELVATMTTSGEGVEKSPLLPLGKYTVKEISAPSGYVLDLTTYTVEIQASDQETPIVSATVSSINHPAEILLQKTEADGKALSGAQFVLLDADGCETASAVSDADGLVRFRFVPQGTPFVKRPRRMGIC